MDSLFLLIPIALILVGIAFTIFLWAVRSGQFEDLDTESKRILFDSDISDKKKATKAALTSDEPKQKDPPTTHDIDNKGK